MAKVQTIKRAKASSKPRMCAVCRSEVQVGESYKRIEKRSGFRSGGGYTLFFCKSCQPRQSHLLSGRSAEYAGITESFEDEMNVVKSKDDILSALDTLKDAVEEFGGSWAESAQNVEDGFGHATSNSERFQANADSLDTWKDEIDSKHSEIEDMVSEEEGVEEETDGDGEDDVEPETDQPEITEFADIVESANEILQSAPDME